MSGRDDGFAGTLRERVTWLRPTSGRDALGAGEQDWTVLDVIAAAVLPAGTSGAFAGDARSALPRWQVTVRPCGIGVGDRIDWAGAILDVQEVQADPRLPDRIVAIGEQRR